MVRPAQFLGPLQGYQPTLPTPSSRTLRVPPQPRAFALASDLRSSLAVHFLDHGRLLAADDPSTSPYTANALLPMSVNDYAVIYCGWQMVGQAQRRLVILEGVSALGTMGAVKAFCASGGLLPQL